MRRLSTAVLEGNWIQLYDERGTGFRKISVQQGTEIVNVMPTGFVTKCGHTLRYYDAEGSNYRTVC